MLGRMETPFNHFFNDRIYPGTLDELTRGPLAAHLKTYAQQLHDEGYAVQTCQYQLRMLGHFNRWLHSEGFAANEIDSSQELHPSGVRASRAADCRRPA